MARMQATAAIEAAEAYAGGYNFFAAPVSPTGALKSLEHASGDVTHASVVRSSRALLRIHVVHHLLHTVIPFLGSTLQLVTSSVMLRSSAACLIVLLLLAMSGLLSRCVETIG